MLRPLIAAVALACCCCPLGAIAAEADLDKLAWLVGNWVERKEGRETEEHWIAPKGGMMLGVNRTVTSAGKSSFEFLRIAKTPEGISYFGSPGGRPPVEFPLKEQSEGRVVFENPQHDFPQRIIYSIEGEVLTARIEGTIAGQQRSTQWRWEKLK